ncbi:hypothetical protein B0H63DRAFT_523809 [Podospora didyma]|uniref:Transmembrane protein n=1 Tax=Podospora didyma TaxID=330526 RepID=A0AAE0NGF8_9PEZI|nr:hypothetical protein B0H63DRAFT_523809 [Podospora didyma]
MSFTTKTIYLFSGAVTARLSQDLIRDFALSATASISAGAAYRLLNILLRSAGLINNDDNERLVFVLSAVINAIFIGREQRSISFDNHEATPSQTFTPFLRGFFMAILSSFVSGAFLLPTGYSVSPSSFWLCIPEAIVAYFLIALAANALFGPRVVMPFCTTTGTTRCPGRRREVKPPARSEAPDPVAIPVQDGQQSDIVLVQDDDSIQSASHAVRDDNDTQPPAGQVAQADDVLRDFVDPGIRAWQFEGHVTLTKSLAEGR